MGRELSGCDLWTESRDSVAFHPRTPSQMWSPEYRVENIGINSSKLQSGIILYKHIHNSGQTILIDDFAFDLCHNSDLRVCIIRRWPVKLKNLM